MTCESLASRPLCWVCLLLTHPAPALLCPCCSVSSPHLSLASASWVLLVLLPSMWSFWLKDHCSACVCWNLLNSTLASACQIPVPYSAQDVTVRSVSDTTAAPGLGLTPEASHIACWLWRRSMGLRGDNVEALAGKQAPRHCKIQRYPGLRGRPGQAAIC